MAVDAPPDAINLALGEPGWPLPDVAREALAAAARENGPLPYGPNTSRPDLVQAIAAHHGRSVSSGYVSPVLSDLSTCPVEPYDVSCPAVSRVRSEHMARPVAGDVTADQVMVTSGSQAALFALFQAHVDPGSTVLVPDPGFVSYPSLARLCGADPVGYPLAPGGHLDADALVETLAAHPHTSMVVLCHPANPTGGMASASALLSVAEACARRGVLLVSDEVYRQLWVDEAPPSLHDVTGVEGGAVLGSVSKAFGAPGLRVGWAVGAAEILAPARIVHNAMTTAPAQPSQAAALALLTATDEVLAESRRHVRERWELAERVAPRLTSLPTAAATPQWPAGIYLWLPVPDGSLADQHDDPTLAFALHLRDDAGVITVPGSAFGPRGAGHLRVSLGGPLDDLREGLRRLAPRWTT